ncbi:MAG: hypothetical protein GY715_10325 [Planctomycetes bacterium]|nr:hypothetical protein [Planctomycetota bacterium]
MAWSMFNRRSLMALAAAALFVAGPATADSKQTFKIDLNELMNETQIMSGDPNRMAMVWWIPSEFWQASMGEDPTVAQRDIDQIVETLRGYTVVAAVDGTLGPFGGVDYRSETDVRSTIQLRDVHGHTHRPLGDDKVKADARNLLQMMKPAIANILGPMGENLHFFFFPANGETEKPIVQPKQRGNFSVVLGHEELQWRLPLGSILPKHSCPKCTEKLSGAFSFCPWDGASLSATVRVTDPVVPE